MIINKSPQIIYDIFIISAVLTGIIYISISLLKDKCNKMQILKFIILFIIFSFIGGKLFTTIQSGFKINLFKASLSSYGGLISVILISYIYEKKIYNKAHFIKYTILSLPLIYSITKLGCFISGCCYGIIYTGPLNVSYPFLSNKTYFPIQILETIVFMIIFQICNFNKNKKDITYNTLKLVIISKFILDFLRYDHMIKLITINQLVSLLILIIIFYKQKQK